MEGATIGNVVARTILIISAAVVLGLSVNLHEIFSDYKDFCNIAYNDRQRELYCSIGRTLPSMAYGIAAGAFSLFDALVGLVAAFVPAIPWVVMAVLDALTAILLLAHGINFAVLLGERVGDVFFRGTVGTRGQADTAFAFIGFIAVCLALVTIFLARRR